MNGKLKFSYSNGVEGQVALWKTRFPQLQGSVDAMSRESANRMLTGTSFLCVLPKFEKVLGDDLVSIYLELQLLEILADSCNNLLCIDFHNSCNKRNGETLFTEEERYSEYRQLVSRQEGDFVVLNMDLGKENPYHEGINNVHHQEKRFPLPLGIIAAALSVQNVCNLWRFDPEMWSASPVTHISVPNSNRTKKREIPCFSFERNFSGGRDILHALPLSEVFFYDTSRKNKGGFATASYPE